MTKRYDSHVLIIQLKFGLVIAGTAVIAVISGTLFTFPLSLPFLPQWNFHRNLACVAWQFCWAEPTSSDAAAARKKKISLRFLCPCPPLLLSAPNQNCHATQANHNYAPQHCIFHEVSTIIVGGALCKENLLLPSWVKHRREGSAWIVWSFWSHWSPNFGTIPSCSLSSNWFSKCERIHLLINQWPWLQACWTKCRAIRPGFKTVS